MFFWPQGIPLYANVTWRNLTLDSASYFEWLGPHHGIVMRMAQNSDWNLHCCSLCWIRWNSSGQRRKFGQFKANFWHKNGWCSTSMHRLCAKHGTWWWILFAHTYMHLGDRMEVATPPHFVDLCFGNKKNACERFRGSCAKCFFVSFFTCAIQWPLSCIQISMFQSFMPSFTHSCPHSLIRVVDSAGKHDATKKQCGTPKEKSI